MENYDTFSDKEREKLEEIVNKSVNGIENKLIVTVKYMEENILPLASFLDSITTSEDFLNDVGNFKKRVVKSMANCVTNSAKVIKRQNKPWYNIF